MENIRVRLGQKATRGRRGLEEEGTGSSQHKERDERARGRGRGGCGGKTRFSLFPQLYVYVAGRSER